LSLSGAAVQRNQGRKFTITGIIPNTGYDYVFPRPNQERAVGGPSSDEHAPLAFARFGISSFQILGAPF